MARVIRRWWQACLAGLVVGIPIGIALEFARRAHNQIEIERTTREFESQGWSPPLMIDFLQPWAVPAATAIAFMILALLIYILLTIFFRIRNQTRRSDTQNDH